jgi:fructokinase
VKEVEGVNAESRTTIPLPPILCFGEALWDLPPGRRIPGGAPMNVALRLARLGAPVTMLSRVGQDELGRELLDFLAAGGLRTEAVQVDPHHPTGRVFVDDSNPQDMRYEIAAPAAWDFIDAADYAARAAGRTDVLVFGSLATRSEVSRESLLRILDSAALKVFDVNLRPPFVDRATIECLLARSDWIKLNDQELDVVGGWSGLAGTEEERLRALGQRCGCDTVCLTKGAGGAVLLHRGELHRQAGFDVRVVDTVGCGDSFLAALLVELLQGADPRRALLRACAMGALVATSAGATAPVAEEDLRALAGA